jgi:predicted MFS family arabinose efflux permease
MIARTVSIYRESFTGLSKSVWLLSLVSLINRSGTMVIPFLSVYLTTKLGFSLAQAGVAMACFGIGSLAGSFLGGYLTDRIGYYPVIFWSLLLGGLMFISLGYVSMVPTVYMTILVLSIIGESFRPATMTAVGAYSYPENRTRSFSLLRMAINMGWSIGPAIGGFLAASVGYGALFWADGLTCIAAAMAFRFILKPQGNIADKDKQQEKDEPNAPSPYQDRTYLLFLSMSTLGAVIFMQVLSSLPVFYKQELQFSEAIIGGLLAMNGLIVVLFEMPVVFTLERKFNGLTNIGLGVLLYGAAYLVLNLPFAGLSLAIFSMFLLSLGEIFNMPFTNTYAMSRTVDGNRGRYMGLFSMSYSLAHIVGPYFCMKIADQWGFVVLWYLLAVLSLVIYGGFILLKKLKQDREFGGFAAKKSSGASKSQKSLCDF